MSGSVFLVVKVLIDKMATKILPFIPQFKVCFVDNETKGRKRKPSKWHKQIFRAKGNGNPFIFMHQDITCKDLHNNTTW